MSKDTIDIIKSLIQEKYPEAKCIFWAGSVSRGQGSNTSDLDLVLIFDNLPNAYREAYTYQSWPVDAFIHDFKTLEYFFEKIDKPSFCIALPQMVAEGVIVLGGKEAEELQAKAQEIIDSKPTISKEDLDRRRFVITDSLDDLKDPNNEHERLAIIFDLYSLLAEFYLLANGHWIGSGKQLAKLLHNADGGCANKFALAFATPYYYNKIHDLALEILKPHGGLLWGNFRSDAPKEWRVK